MRAATHVLAGFESLSFCLGATVWVGTPGKDIGPKFSPFLKEFRKVALIFLKKLHKNAFVDKYCLWSNVICNNMRFLN